MHMQAVVCNSVCFTCGVAFSGKYGLTPSFRIYTRIYTSCYRCCCCMQVNWAS